MRYQISRRTFLRTGTAFAGSFLLNPEISFAKSRPLLTFGIVTDSHYADRDPAGTRHYRESLGKMREAMKEMNSRKVDFVVHLGDFKDQDSNPSEQSTLEYVRRQEAAFATFIGPRYHVLGNHDQDSITKTQFQENVVNTGIPKEKTYYSFDKKGFHFVVLDANFTKDGTPYDKGNFDWKECLIPDEELDWLSQDLETTKLPVVILAHQLLDNVNDHYYCVQNADEVRRVLEGRKNVLAVFQGHRHETRYHKLEDIHYCTLPAMVDHAGLENNSFSVVEIYRNHEIHVVGYKRAPEFTFRKV